MAIADIGGEVAGKKIELLVADHQNKPDVAAAKAREWFDTQGVDMLIGGTNSGTGLAMAKVAPEKKKPFIVDRRRRTSALTNEQCTPYTVHYAYDTDGAGQGHRQRRGQGRRQELVLPDRRLRLRHALQNDATDGRQGRRRHGRRLGARSRSSRATSRRSCCRRRQQGADPGPGQRRRRHHQLDQGGQRVRHHQDDEAGRPADVHQRRALARPEGDAGHVPDRQLVLEPATPSRAPGAATLLRQVQAHAVVAAGRRLLGDAAAT